MLKNYFKTTFRRLWRHKLFTFLNIIGLAIGIAASWLIFRIADYELSYDTDLPDIENTYRLITHVRQNATETTYGGISPPIYQAIQDEVTGVERAVPVFVQWHATVEVPKESAAPLVLETREGLVATQKEYFELRPYTWLAGNVNSAFDNPASVVLTQSRAQLYFPSTEPSEVIDKVLVYDGGMQKTVSGVVKDLDSPSEFTAEEFFYLEPKTYHLGAWTGTNGGAKVYLQLYPGSNPELVLQQINQLSEEKWDDFRATLDQPIFVSKKYDLLPMSESHFSTHVLDVEIRKASKPVIYGLIGVGGFLMLLACINYINLSTAQIPKRSKEIGIRKTLGGRQNPARGSGSR
jgi:putative ABC transport system permease protein